MDSSIQATGRLCLKTRIARHPGYTCALCNLSAVTDGRHVEKAARVLDDHVVRQQFDYRPLVTPQVRLECRLHVLLRHRPRSIAQAQESA